MKQYILAITLLIANGCVHPTREQPTWNAPRAWSPESDLVADRESRDLYPESALSDLTKQQRAEFDMLYQNVSQPPENPYESDKDLGELYLDWYRKGFAYSYVTGVENLRDQQFRESTHEQAVARGWFDGNGAGAHARFQETLQQETDHFNEAIRNNEDRKQ